ncbi:unnamed protein product [Ambrosiozyma monospora]|uniref:Unnamed protein product n=1 Tax=Ambrosiozyma monospora TaxID=43982 RepID=A0ACB5T4T0_AMBMO|nr:unnamed protein product [Ambrosiozyma monospora]
MKCVSDLMLRVSQGYELSHLQQLIKDGKTNAITSSKEDKILQLKQMSRNCMIYAGMIQYKMPREVYATLIALDVNI